MSQAITRTERYRDWQEVMTDWEASNETQESYCQSRNINYSKFKSWRSRIATDRKKNQNQNQNQKQFCNDYFIPLQLNPKEEDQASSVAKHIGDNHIRIELQAGIKIFIPISAR